MCELKAEITISSLWLIHIIKCGRENVNLFNLQLKKKKLLALSRENSEMQ